MDERLPPRIFLRPLGSPMTAAMSGLAIASLVQSGLELRWIAASQGRQVGLILIAVPFVLQLIACVLAYLARDGATGAAIGVLSSTWLALGLIHLSAAPGTRSGALGLLLLSAAVVLSLSSAAIAVLKPLPSLVFILAAARFALAGVYQLSGGSSWQDGAGIVGLVICALAAYCVLAFELEGEMHRPVLPTFRRVSGRTVVTSDLETQLQRLAGEPGIRETT